MNKQKINFSEIREVAMRFDTQTIAECQQQAINNQGNTCYSNSRLDEVMNVLAKAGFIRSEMDKGKQITQAFRELGKRVRAIQGS